VAAAHRVHGKQNSVFLKSVAVYRLFNSYCFPKYVHSLQNMPHHACVSVLQRGLFKAAVRGGVGGLPGGDQTLLCMKRLSTTWLSTNMC
jgi:hypothetical protein